jgi:hypothetical protein
MDTLYGARLKGEKKGHVQKFSRDEAVLMPIKAANLSEACWGA